MKVDDSDRVSAILALTRDTDEVFGENEEETATVLSKSIAVALSNCMKQVCLRVCMYVGIYAFFILYIYIYI